MSAECKGDTHMNVQHFTEVPWKFSKQGDCGQRDDARGGSQHAEMQCEGVEGYPLKIVAEAVEEVDSDQAFDPEVTRTLLRR